MPRRARGRDAYPTLADNRACNTGKPERKVLQELVEPTAFELQPGSCHKGATEAPQVGPENNCTAGRRPSSCERFNRSKAPWTCTHGTSAQQVTMVQLELQAEVPVTL